MIKFVKIALESAVMLFALYAFATVPLGKRTGLEHLQAILKTDEAKQAGHEIKRAGGRILGELLEFETGEVRGDPEIPEELRAPAESLITEQTLGRNAQSSNGPLSATPNPASEGPAWSPYAASPPASESSED